MTPPVAAATRPVDELPIHLSRLPGAPVPVALADILAGALTAASTTGSAALDQLAGARPLDRSDRFLTLLATYDLSTGPLHVVGDAVRWQNAPQVVALKARLEADWLAELETVPVPDGLPADVVRGMRALAARDRLPAAYRWLAKEADWAQVVEFLAVEGGPDAGFDDLIAVCQVGLSGSAKLELAQNFWDEMGNGELHRVHTVLHEDLVAAIRMPRLPRAQLPVEALERIALSGLFATNRWLQPEMIGALGLLELQAGPRCRLVLQAFDRLGAPEGAYPFYEEHAVVDPRHGKDWLEKAIEPLAREHPDWAARMVRGAWWRARTNDALFDRLWTTLAGVRTAA